MWIWISDRFTKFHAKVSEGYFFEHPVEWRRRKKSLRAVWVWSHWRADCDCVSYYNPSDHTRCSAHLSLAARVQRTRANYLLPTCHICTLTPSNKHQGLAGWGVQGAGPPQPGQRRPVRLAKMRWEIRQDWVDSYQMLVAWYTCQEPAELSTRFFWWRPLIEVETQPPHFWRKVSLPQSSQKMASVDK